MASTCSLIIPSYNGLHRLKTTLQSFLPVLHKVAECILVIDGSNDGTQDWLKSQSLPKNFITYVQENKGRAAARNTGIALAHGDIVIFVDDDIRIPPNFVERHLELQSCYPNSLISGQIFQDLNATTNLDFCRFRRYQEALWAKSLPDQRNAFRGFHFSSGNLSINRNLIKSLGGFNDSLSDCEDFYLGIIARKNLVPIYFDPTLICYHCDYRNLSSYIQRSLEYIRSKQDILSLCPEALREYSYAFQVPSSSRPFLSLMRRLFVYNHAWARILASPLFVVLPLDLRYRLYDYVISSSVWASSEAKAMNSLLQAQA